MTFHYQQQLKAHELECQELKKYFSKNMTEFEKSNYNFLQDSPKKIIESLYEELQG